MESITIEDMVSLTRLSRSKWLAFLLVVLIAASGCTPIDLGGNYGRNPSPGGGDTSESGVFQTATPPTSPDLRGDSFSILLFTVEGGRYVHSANSIMAGIRF